MPFYLRKAFKKGPVRFNLSKSGLGLSVGVTGARLGVNSRGTYVHGGRHGMYYRKNLPKHASPNNKNTQDGSSVELFSHTGVTFTQSKVAPFIPYEIKHPKDSTVLADTSVIIGIIFLVISLFINIEAFLIAFAIFMFGIGVGVAHRQKLKQARNVADEIITKLIDTGSLPDADYPGVQRVLNNTFSAYFSEMLHAQASEIALNSDEIDTMQTFKKLEASFPIHPDKQKHIRSSILAGLLDQMLEDQMLSEEEEKAFLETLSISGLKKDDIPTEMARLEQFKALRIAMESPLSEIQVPIPLLRGERAYAVFDPIRVLNERVLRRFQQDRVQYRETGYEIDLEGVGYLTDRRLLVQGNGSREIRLNTILDVIADTEGGIVELIVSNRKTPLILTCPDVIQLAALIEKVRDNN